MSKVVTRLKNTFTRDRRGSVLIFVVGILVILALMATAHLATVRLDRTTVTAAVGGGQSAVAETLNAVPFIGNLWVIQFLEAAGASYQGATMTCRLPPQAKFSFAGIGEDVATDTPDPAP